MEIRTNNVPRFTIDGFDLTSKEREGFDYLDWPAIDEGTESATFFRYKGTLYDIGEFVTTDIPGWDGIHTDTFFSGTVIRFTGETCESIVVGYAYA